MKRAFLILGAALLVGLLLVAAYHTYSPRHTPDGQPPLAAILPESLPAFQKLFNDSADSARILVLLSPT